MSTSFRSRCATVAHLATQDPPLIARPAQEGKSTWSKPKGEINTQGARRSRDMAGRNRVARTTTGRRAAPNASAEGARQKRNPSIRPLFLVKDKEKWRRHPDSNRGITVLQTVALPLGYAASDRSPSLSLFSPSTPTAATVHRQSPAFAASSCKIAAHGAVLSPPD